MAHQVKRNDAYELIVHRLEEPAKLVARNTDAQPHYQVQMDGRGRIYCVHGRARDQLLVFDANGKQLKSVDIANSPLAGADLIDTFDDGRLVFFKRGDIFDVRLFD